MTTEDRNLLLPNWRSTTLGEVARLETGGTPSPKNQQYWANGNIPWVKTTEIDYRVIEKTGETYPRAA